ncbi:hypothetical protein MKX08_003834 [Trichoderma sp. CBMAI-0020]|nr:hypothetical protein MKX08_003834 [Trichoderma sp. CBMAI-0020]WOD45846.1 hypothetical protein [Trichoderma atroviride]
MSPPPPPPTRASSPSSSEDAKDLEKMSETTSSSEAGPSTARPPTPPPTPPEVQPDGDGSRDSVTDGPNCPFFLQGHCPSGQKCLFDHDEFVLWLQERQELTLPEVETPPETSQSTSSEAAEAAAQAAQQATQQAAAQAAQQAAIAALEAAFQVAAVAEAAEAARAAAQRAAQRAAQAVLLAATRPPVVGSTCRSLAVSWPKPGKVAVLGYGSLDLATDECAKFNGHSLPRKLVGGHEVTAILSAAARPGEAPRASRAPSQVAVFFGPSVKTADEKLARSIRKSLTPGPRQVRMAAYTASEAETMAAVRSLLAAVAPLELFHVKQDSTKTRLEATAWFPDLVAALEACRRLDKKSLPFCPEAELSVRVHEIDDTCSSRCHNRG